MHFILDGFFCLCYSLPVKTKLQDSFDKLCFQTVLNIVIDMSPIGRQVFNASCVVPQYRVYCVRLSGNRFFNDFKGYQLLVPHALILTIPFSTASMPRVSSNSLYFCFVRTRSRLLYQYNRGRNTSAEQSAVAPAISIMRRLTSYLPQQSFCPFTTKTVGLSYCSK